MGAGGAAGAQANGGQAQPAQENGNGKKLTMAEKKKLKKKERLQAKKAAKYVPISMPDEHPRAEGRRLIQLRQHCAPLMP